MTRGALIDTSAWSRTATSAPVFDAVSALRSVLELYTCPVLDLEILFSARGIREYERWQSIRRAAYTYIALTPAIGERALDVQHELARTGRHRAVRFADLLIAACAESAGVTVVHYDADYELIAGVTAQSVAWVVPRGRAD